VAAAAAVVVAAPSKALAAFTAVQNPAAQRPEGVLDLGIPTQHPTGNRAPGIPTGTGEGGGGCWGRPFGRLLGHALGQKARRICPCAFDCVLESKRNAITCSGAASARVVLVRAHLLVAYCN
jgi:hypothetical protein